MIAQRRLAVVWIRLLALTFGSALIGFEQHAGFAAQATLIILGIALIKVRLIGVHFMDLRNAHPALRRAFDAYVLVVFLVLMTIDIVAKA